MDLINKIVSMQNQGISEADISKQLQNQGISPLQINQAINQAKIKSAVSSETPYQETQPTPQNNEFQNMQMSSFNQQNPIPDNSQNPQQAENQNFQYPPQNQEEYYPQTPQAYTEQDYYAPQSNLDTDTISEIAEQIVIEKFKEFHKKTGDIVSFKNLIQDKVADLNERLKRIEDSINKLQQSIIGKVGEFGENTSLIHRDLENLHGTVSKLMNPLIDNYNELKKNSK
jgi:hypothetical protein